MRILLALLLLAASALANADVFRPAYLEITERPDRHYDIFWKVPSLGGGTRLSAYVRLPDSAQVTREPRIVEIDGAWNERWQVHVPDGLVGHEILIEGNAVGVTDVIARVVRLDGSSQVERLPIDRPRFEVTPPAGHGEVAWSYLVLGVEHILGGIDHLLFVLALLLIVRGGRRILATVTAFTVAHSITLVGATLGWMHVPGPPVEAIIALSIAFVAMEILHGLDGRPGLTARAPWVVAFSFGLLHGFGFAGALEEVGLPQIGHTDRAADVQCRRGNRPAHLRVRVPGPAPGVEPRPASAVAAMAGPCDFLRDRHCRHVLGDRAHARIYLSPLRSPDFV